MKKLLMLFMALVTFTCAMAVSNPAYDYSIVFTGTFKKDKISLSINNVTIFKDYELDNSCPEAGGNLSLTQTEKGLKISYNNRQQFVDLVRVEDVMDVRITVNNVVNNFKVDLRKGRIILVDCPTDEKGAPVKNVFIAQLEEEMVFD